MRAKPITRTSASEIAIFGRLLRNGTGRMSRDLARYVLTLGFGEEDQARLTELADRNQEGRLSAAEKEELLHYVKAGHLLALLHAQARRDLKKQVS